MIEFVRLQGKNGIGYPYIISIQVEDDKIKTLVMTGKPCKPVRDIVEDFQKTKDAFAQDVINSIKLTMATHNEYSLTARP